MADSPMRNIWDILNDVNANERIPTIGAENHCQDGANESRVEDFPSSDYMPAETVKPPDNEQDIPGSMPVDVKPKISITNSGTIPSLNFMRNKFKFQLPKVAKDESSVTDSDRQNKVKKRMIKTAKSPKKKCSAPAPSDPMTTQGSDTPTKSTEEVAQQCDTSPENDSTTTEETASPKKRKTTKPRKRRAPKEDSVAQAPVTCDADEKTGRKPRQRKMRKKASMVTDTEETPSSAMDLSATASSDATATPSVNTSPLSKSPKRMGSSPKRSASKDLGEGGSDSCQSSPNMRTPQSIEERREKWKIRKREQRQRQKIMAISSNGQIDSESDLSASPSKRSPPKSKSTKSPQNKTKKNHGIVLLEKLPSDTIDAMATKQDELPAVHPQNDSALSSEKDMQGVRSNSTANGAPHKGVIESAKAGDLQESESEGTQDNNNKQNKHANNIHHNSDDASFISDANLSDVSRKRKISLCMSMPDIVPVSEYASSLNADESNIMRTQYQSAANNFASPKVAVYSKPQIHASHSQPNLAIDEAPLDLSKKDAPIAADKLSLLRNNTIDLDTSCDMPLDLTIRRTGSNIVDEVSCRPKAERQSRPNRDEIFQAFSVKGGVQSRKVSPVRPHIRGRPVDLHNVNVNIANSNSAMNRPFQRLLTSNKPTQDYTVFSVKAPFADSLTHKVVNNSDCDVDDNSLPHTFRISDGLIQNTSGCSNGESLSRAHCSGNLVSTVLNVPAYYTKHSTSFDSAVKSLFTDGVIRCQRNVPTAHVKPTAVQDKTSQIGKRTARKSTTKQSKKLSDKSKPGRRSKPNNKISSEDHAGDDDRAMPVLSPHRDIPLDNKQASKGDSYTEITPPPPPLTRQKTPSPIMIDLSNEDIPDLSNSVSGSLSSYTDTSESGSSVSPFGAMRTKMRPSQGLMSPGNGESKREVKRELLPVIGYDVEFQEPNDSSNKYTGFNDHIAFNFKPRELKRYCDIANTQYYQSLFGSKDVTPLDQAIAAKTNAFDIFPSFEFTNDWKQDLVKYKIKNLRIPEKLVTVPRNVPLKFMQDIDRFLPKPLQRIRKIASGELKHKKFDIMKQKKMLSKDAKTSTKVRGRPKKNTENLLQLSAEEIKLEKKRKRKQKKLDLIEATIQFEQQSASTHHSAGSAYHLDMVTITELVAIQAVQALTTSAALAVKVKKEPVNKDYGLVKDVLKADLSVKNQSNNEQNEFTHPVKKRRGRKRNSEIGLNVNLLPGIRGLKHARISTPSTESLRMQQTSTPVCSTARPPNSSSSPIKSQRRETASAKSSTTGLRRKSSRSPKGPRRFSEDGWVFPQDLRRINYLQVLPNNYSFDADDNLCPSKSGGDTLSSSLMDDSKLITHIVSAYPESEHANISQTTARINSPIRKRSPKKTDAASPWDKTVTSNSSSSTHDSSLSRFSESSSAEKKRQETKAQRRAARKKRRTILDELANTDGYVAEKKLEKTNESLLLDPSQLSREERALQRAMMKFSEMEYFRYNKSCSMDNSTSSTQSSTMKRAGELKKQAIKGHKITGPDGKPIYEMNDPQGQNTVEQPSTSVIQITSNQLKVCKRRRRISHSTDATGHVSPLKKGRKKGESWSKCFFHMKKRRRSSFGLNRIRMSGSSSVDISQARQAIFEPPRIEIDATPDNYAFPSPATPSPVKASLSSPSVHLRHDDDNMSMCSSGTGDIPRHLIPPEVKRLTACKDTGETILHKAARLAYYDIVNWCCVTNYVDVNARDHAGFAALHETCVSESVDVARCLLEHGADVNVASRLDGVRPLHDAVDRDNFELVRLFLAWGADPTLTTYSGKNALTIAHTDEMKQFFQAYFTDLNGASDEFPETPWTIPLEINVGPECDPYGSDFLCGLPADSEDLDASTEHIVFEMSDVPIIPCFQVVLDPTARPTNCILASHLLQRLRMSEHEFSRLYPDIRIYTRDITKMEGPQVLSLLRACERSIKTDLIEYTDFIKGLLGLEMFTLTDADIYKETRGKQSNSEQTADLNVSIESDITDSDRSTIPADDDEELIALLGKPDMNGFEVDGHQRETTPCFEDRFSYTDCKGCSSPELEDWDDTETVSLPHSVETRQNSQESGIGTATNSQEIGTESTSTFPSNSVMISLLTGKTIAKQTQKRSRASFPPAKNSVADTAFSVYQPCQSLLTSNNIPKPLFILSSGSNPIYAEMSPIIMTNQPSEIVTWSSPSVVPSNGTCSDTGEQSEDDMGLKIAQVCSLSASDAQQVFGSDVESSHV